MAAGLMVDIKTGFLQRFKTLFCSDYRQGWGHTALSKLLRPGVRGLARYHWEFLRRFPGRFLSSTE